MKLYKLSALQKLPIDQELAWEFISSPKNLSVITPKHMKFQICSGNEGEKMYPGMIIAYKVSPILGIPLNWVTEITQMEESSFFVDEQRFGPYKFWHHKHFIKPINNGVQMEDVVHYGLPMGMLGRFANSVIVKKQLQQIFSYRFNALENLFGRMNDSDDTVVSRKILLEAV